MFQILLCHFWLSLKEELVVKLATKREDVFCSCLWRKWTLPNQGVLRKKLRIRVRFVAAERCAETPQWMAEGVTGKRATPGPVHSSSGDSTSRGEIQPPPHSPEPAYAIPDQTTYNYLTEQKVKLSLVYNNRKKYLLHHTAAEVLDLEKLTELGRETNDLLYCFFEPAYLPTKQIFLDEQADHLALIWASQFQQYLPQ